MISRTHTTPDTYYIDDDAIDLDDELWFGDCPACGEFADYCQGHGTDDIDARATIELHDEFDRHEFCHGNACEYAGLSPREIDALEDARRRVELFRDEMARLDALDATRRSWFV